ncbi:MAG TPA: NAD-dependent epimerase/dehydratase family protein [Mycobacteriales bacterium]|nr:NAD-dependent epimerase/dehydratase family protein [Mycobacteriales bacterium]
MSPRVVLVTGASRDLGSRLVAALHADPSLRVIAVDSVPPQGSEATLLADAEFVRADIRTPALAKIISEREVDTVVHLNVIATPRRVGGRAAMKEINVIGTMQLLAACQRAEQVRKLVVKSTTAVYGSSPRDPALFTEDYDLRVPRGGYAKDAVEVEGYVRGFGRRRPDVTLSVLRFTNFIGPTMQTPLSRYLSLPVVPTVFGFDPRLQLCHEDDAVTALQRMVTEDHPGIYNVGGPGVLLLSQAIRRAGRVSLPVPSPAVNALAKSFQRGGLFDVSPDQMSYLRHGRVADVSRLGARLGWTPRPTAEAFADHVSASAAGRVLDPAAVARSEGQVLNWARQLSKDVRDG